MSELTGDLLYGSKIQINAGGLIGRGRQKNDGVVFFGKSNTSGEKFIDLAMNVPESSNSGKILFIVYFKKENKKFYVRAYRDKSNVGIPNILIKLTDPYVLII